MHSLSSLRKMKLPAIIKRAALTTMAATSSSSSSALNNGACSVYPSHISELATSLKPRVLVSARGSGNYGESGTAAFYTIDRLPIDFNENNHKISKLERTDLDLGENRLAFYIDNVLTSDEADVLAACAEAVLEENDHSRMAPGIHTPPGMRINEAAHWYPSRELAPSLLGAIFQRIQPLVPQTLDGLSLYPRLSEKVAQFKYNQGDQFQRHIDGLFPGQGANEEGNGVDEWMGVFQGCPCYSS